MTRPAALSLPVLRGRSLVHAALVTVILAACGGQIAPSESATETSAPSTAPTVLSTPGSFASPEPTVAGPCSGDLPTTLASVQELADSSCYGPTELTIDGWLAESGVGTDPGETEPSWTNAWVKLYAGPPTAGQFMIDFLQADRVPGGIDVVTPPRTGIDLSGNGRWVTVTGHFNDAIASACTKVRKQSSDRDCADLFVVTDLETRPSDSPACPAGSPIDLERFLEADARCFRGHDVRLRAWEDVGEGFGGTGPIWRVDYSASLRLAEAQLVARPFEVLGEDPYLFVWTAKGSGVRFDARDQQVLVTAMLGHPAARDCRPESYDGWAWAPPVTWAQHFCERILVITNVRARD